MNGSYARLQEVLLTNKWVLRTTAGSAIDRENKIALRTTAGSAIAKHLDLSSQSRQALQDGNRARLDLAFHDQRGDRGSASTRT